MKLLKPNAKVLQQSPQTKTTLKAAKQEYLDIPIGQGSSKSSKCYFGLALKLLKDYNLGNLENCLNKTL